MLLVRVLVLSVALLARPAAAQDETVAETKLFVGADLIALGDFAQAVPHLQEALALDPGLCRAHYHLARAQLGVRTVDSLAAAAVHAEAYRECDPSSSGTADALLQEISTAEPAEPPPDSEPVAVPGSPVQANPAQPAQARVRMGPRRRAGTAMLVVGGVTAAGGFAGNVGVALYGYENQDDDQLYEAARKSSNALLGVGIVGAAMGAAGLIMALVPEPQDGAVAFIPGPVSMVVVRF